MNTETLEELLQGLVETPSFDIKADMPWDAVKMAKHILAMSNVRDGGAIVVGVENDTFRRTGVCDLNLATYHEEAMQDQIAPFADPSVQFRVTKPVGRDGLVFVAIEVSTFRDVPIICKKQTAKTRAGAIYYRSAARRVNSAEIDNSYDMRDLLNLAASRTAARNRSFGFVPDPSADTLAEALDAELDGL